MRKSTASLVLSRRMQLTVVVQPQWKSTRSRANPKAKDRKGNHRKEKAKTKEPRKAAKARANYSRAAKVMVHPPKEVAKLSQRQLMSTVATTVEPMAIGRKTAESFKLTEHQVLSDKLR